MYPLGKDIKNSADLNAGIVAQPPYLAVVASAKNIITVTRSDPRRVVIVDVTAPGQGGL